MQAWLIKPLATVTELYLQPFPLRVGGMYVKILIMA